MQVISSFYFLHSSVKYKGGIKPSSKSYGCSPQDLKHVNLPSVVWSNPSCPVGSDTLSSTFCSISQDSFFHQMVLNPTRGNNILDLVLSTAPDLLLDLSVNEGLGSSDHSSIAFNLRLKILRPKQSPRIVYNFGSANWNNLRDDFSNYLGILLS